MPTGSFGWGGLMLKDPKLPMNPKETSLITNSDASMKMYDINNVKRINQTKPSQINQFSALNNPEAVDTQLNRLTKRN